jgi:hypothetical protein
MERLGPRSRLSKHSADRGSVQESRATPRGWGSVVSCSRAQGAPANFHLGSASKTRLGSGATGPSRSPRRGGAPGGRSLAPLTASYLWNLAGLGGRSGREPRSGNPRTSRRFSGGGSHGERSSIRAGWGRSAAGREHVAGARAADQPADQATTTERQWWKHVLAAVAADLRLGSGPVVRPLLRETPNPRRHPIPPELILLPPASFRALEERLFRPLRVGLLECIEIRRPQCAGADTMRATSTRSRWSQRTNSGSTSRNVSACWQRQVPPLSTELVKRCTPRAAASSARRGRVWAEVQPKIGRELDDREMTVVTMSRPSGTS